MNEYCIGRKLYYLQFKTIDKSYGKENNFETDFFVNMQQNESYPSFCEAKIMIE